MAILRPYLAKFNHGVQDHLNIPYGNFQTLKKFEYRPIEAKNGTSLPAL
jgi:hypothetical protein